mmetsp:Transcript_35409/g.69452  ORF Transcript_35409/g.69452 Transcript_35409/m.69452 type:complete len:84 (-) Transcript_35409:169-420(-)
MKRRRKYEENINLETTDYGELCGILATTDRQEKRKRKKPKKTKDRKKVPPIILSAPKGSIASSNSLCKGRDLKGTSGPPNFRT